VTAKRKRETVEAAAGATEHGEDAADIAMARCEAARPAEGSQAKVGWQAGFEAIENGGSVSGRRRNAWSGHLEGEFGHWNQRAGRCKRLASLCNATAPGQLQTSRSS
jgi:hypothetical protein